MKRLILDNGHLTSSFTVKFYVCLLQEMQTGLHTILILHQNAIFTVLLKNLNQIKSILVLENKLYKT